MAIPRNVNDMWRQWLEEQLASGGGGSSVEVTNFPATQAVTGPLTNAQLTAVTGAANAAAWDGSAASATIVPILKAIHAQLVTIAANTTPTP